jgi:hypothetical protein
VRLIFVSTGNPIMAAAFRERLGLDAPIWVDRHRRTYQHLGFKRGLFNTLGPKSVLHYLRSFRKGFRQGRTQGDPLQQGGVVVVRKGGQPVYGYASAEGGDLPPTDQVIAAALRAAKS